LISQVFDEVQEVRYIAIYGIKAQLRFVGDICNAGDQRLLFIAFAELMLEGL